MTATHEDPAAAPAESKWRSHAPALVLALILVVAAVLRFWSLGHGLPYAYNLDERAHFVPHAVAMTGGDLNPGYFINPPALTYLFAAWLSVIHLGGVEQWFADDPGAVFLWSRMIAAAFGVGAVAATYAAGREWFDRRAGLVAAAIMAVAFLPVFYSRLALNDGPAVLPCALALWASAIVLRTGSTKALLAGGACVGLAASLKYSDGAIVVALVAAALLSPNLVQAGHQGPRVRGADRDRRRDRDQPVPVRGLGHVHARPRPPAQVRLRPRAAGPARAQRLGLLRHELDLGARDRPGLLAVAGGVLLLVKGKRREALVLGSLVVLYFLYMGSQSRFYARWMLPLYPALAMLAAYAITQIKQRVVFGVMVALVLIPSAYTTLRNAIVLGREDTRSETRDWLVRTFRRERRWCSSRWRRASGTASPPAGAEGRSRPPVGPLHPQFRGHRATRAGVPRRALHGVVPELSAHAVAGDARRLPPRGLLLGRDRLHAVRPRADRAAPRAAGAALLPRAARAGRRGLPRQPGGGRDAAALPGRQVLQLRDGAYERPGPEMIVYKLRDCT